MITKFTTKVVVVIHKNDKILLIKEKIKKHPEPRYNVIKGTVEELDSSIMAAGHREAEEEVSLQIKIENYICIIQKKKDESVTIYHALNASTEGTPVLKSYAEQDLRDESITACEWKDKSEILKMKPDDFVDPMILDILTKCINGESYAATIFQEI